MDMEFAEMMRELGLPPSELENGLAVGVSGGSDSTALALLAYGWCMERDIPFLAIVCDHGLRRESKNEAALAADRLISKGLDCRVLALHVQPGTAIQERARDARYKAMASLMRRSGIGVLAVAHHAMDQAETVAHRIQGGGSTVLGCAGMLSVRVMEDALLIRPLLGCGRGSLRDYLREEGMEWTEDPSNSDRKYARVRIRQALAVEPGEVEKLLELAASSLKTLQEVHEERDRILSNAVVDELPWGAFLVDTTKLGRGAACAEAMREVICRASGTFPSVDHSKLLSFASRPSTLGGAEISELRKGVSWVHREVVRMQTPSLAKSYSTWDGRIRLADQDIKGCTLEAFGAESATVLRRKRMVDEHIPHKVLSTAPCVRDSHGRVISLPQLRLGDDVAMGVAMRQMPRLSLPGKELTPPLKPVY